MGRGRGKRDTDRQQTASPVRRPPPENAAALGTWAQSPWRPPSPEPVPCSIPLRGEGGRKNGQNRRRVPRLLGGGGDRGQACAPLTQALFDPGSPMTSRLFQARRSCCANFRLVFRVKLSQLGVFWDGLIVFKSYLKNVWVTLDPSAARGGRGAVWNRHVSLFVHLMRHLIPVPTSV